MVCRTFASQCLQFSAHAVPVMDIVGNCVGEEW